ncbi:MAG: S9 family peptidase, partial [bacterium]|nr:S9 family peptidase [bacterium]
AKDGMSVPLNLTNEKHLLILKVCLAKSNKGSIQFRAFLENKKPFENEKIKQSLIPTHRVNTGNILNMIDVTRVRVSPDGRWAAVFLSQTGKETGKAKRWIEILNTAAGAAIFSSENFGKMSNLKWLKNSRGFTYTKTEKKKTSIIRYDMNTHKQKYLVKGIESFDSYWWADDNSFLIYSVAHPLEDKEGYRYVKDITDRSRFPEDRYSMYLFFPAGKLTRRLSGKTQNFNNAVISPDSKKVLLVREEPDYKNRPFTKNSVYLFDLKSHAMKKLLESHALINFMWAPDSKRLLMLGGASAFNGLGLNLQKGKIPNDYDNQAYIYDLNTKKAEAISKNFDPSIGVASWSSSNNNIYFIAEDTSFVRIFKYSRSKKTFRRLNTAVDVVRRAGFAKRRNIAVFSGSGTTTPYRLYKLNLSSNKISVLKDYNRAAFRNVNLGTHKSWNYKTKEGKFIMGRLYLPPGFNPSGKYPCIVYYYGGTSPVTRDFGGRYPKNWYAAHGYIVYVLQPTGATGFGQEASAVHVNDWGKVTSEEIIAAVKGLVKEHRYIDPARIGAMGASYGGFLTQQLAAKTDVFAAYISHAGISSLSSYWGEGDWGYAYSGVATAESFPWNRKDIYVGHSPLFMADRIQNPLLLLHGDADNNVPPGESYQMFAALKLLGKEVALITFTGEQHFIMEYKKRLRWMRSIMAWWDKHLKNQPEHWNHMYKPYAGAPLLK